VGVAWVTWPNFEISGPPYNFGTNRDICFKFGIDIDGGPLLRPAIKWPLSGRGLGSRDPWPNFEISGPPYNFGTNRDICFKFGTYIDDGPLLRPDQKVTPKWAWLRVTWPSFEISGPPNNFCTNRAIRFKFGTYIDDAPLRRANHKMTPKWAWPGSRDQISQFWDSLITLQWIEISASNLAYI